MSEPKFTPGPWYVKPREEIKSMYGSSYTRTTILDSQDGGYSPRHVIAQIAHGNGQEEANARLIAAAPEMYELLDRIKGMLEFCKLENSIDAETEHEIDRLLKKARGEQK